MDFMQLEMFVATVEVGVQRAARRVNRTQPAVSMAVRKLEAEIGAPLFDRSNRGAYVLTASGELLYASAKRMLALRDSSLSEVRELHHLDSGRVRIGANESAGNYLLPPLIQAFRKQHPKIRIEVSRQNSRQLIQEMREKVIDIAVTSFVPDERELEAVPLMRDDVILVGSPQHPMAGKRSVRIEELGQEGFIAHTVASPAREHVVKAFRDLDTPLNITMEVATLETIKNLVAMNLGMAFLPGMCVRKELERGDLVQVPLTGFKYQRTLWLARRRADSHSHAAEEFVKLALAGAPLARGRGFQPAPAIRAALSTGDGSL